MKIKLEGSINQREVYLNGSYLDPAPSQKVYNHSPDGFMWGYGGSGPAQLALALLLNFADKNFALKYYQEVKEDVVAKLPQDDFDLGVSVVLDWIKQRRP